MSVYRPNQPRKNPRQEPRIPVSTCDTPSFNASPPLAALGGFDQLQRIYDRFGPSLLTHLRVEWGNVPRDSREDVIQEIFISLIKNGGTVFGCWIYDDTLSDDEILTKLYRITMTVTISWIRRREAAKRGGKTSTQAYDEELHGLRELEGSGPFDSAVIDEARRNLLALGCKWSQQQRLSKRQFVILTVTAENLPLSLTPSDIVRLLTPEDIEEFIEEPWEHELSIDERHGRVRGRVKSAQSHLRAKLRKFSDGLF